MHVGGDAVLGLRVPEIAEMFEKDAETDAIVVFGEIGSSQEEDLADLIEAGKVTKPVVAYIGGKAAKEGTRFSHAGAIIEGNKGTHAGKVAALHEAGATVVDAFGELRRAVVWCCARWGVRALCLKLRSRRSGRRRSRRSSLIRLRIAGYDIADLMGKVSFGASVYLILTGKLPNEKTARLMDAILVIEH